MTGPSHIVIRHVCADADGHSDTRISGISMPMWRRPDGNWEFEHPLLFNPRAYAGLPENGALANPAYTTDEVLAMSSRIEVPRS